MNNDKLKFYKDKLNGLNIEMEAIKLALSIVGEIEDSEESKVKQVKKVAETEDVGLPEEYKIPKSIPLYGNKQIAILNIFRTNNNEVYSPYEIHKKVHSLYPKLFKNTKESCISGHLHILMKKGLLQKVAYGKYCYDKTIMEVGVENE